MTEEMPAAETPPESLWLATTPETHYDPLKDGLDVDTAVVGAGITGLTAAVRLDDAGQDVAVIEADRVVTGATGYTTAKLTSQHGLIYDYLRSNLGDKKARKYARANEGAIDEVASWIEALDIDCDFERRPAYTYATSPDDRESVRAEAEAAAGIGLPADFVETTELPYDVSGAVRFDEQAQFHPRSYLLTIAEEIDGGGSYVFEETRARDIDPGSPCEVATDRGRIVADNVIVASHFPFFDHNGYFARMHPKQAYLLAVRIDGTPPEGMYYSAGKPADTLRSHPVAGEELLIVGGQGHKTGENEPPTSERYRRCEQFAREHFDVESVEYRWSTHDYYPVDRVPFVGRLGPGIENVYVGTGFKGWGMTGGTAAGMILSQLLRTGSHPWADVFDPLRVGPRESAKKFVTENTEVAGHFVGDWAKALLSPTEIPAQGEAKIVREDGHPYGVYRDEDGEIHAVSAVCPHMSCVVSWNDAERSWDCPCHGSRFDYDGEVLSGPALDDLPRR
jgi:glycine/D-amino acid oxidase-like deaminating enzyme/nitrite reductase/ring-hydroxylating ferredoxin subunit